MKTSKKLLALLLVFVLCVSAMVGCGGKDTAEDTTTTTAAQAEQTTAAQEEDAKDPTSEYTKFALMLQSTWNPFFAEVRVGVEDALNEKWGEGNFELAVLDGNSDINKQVNDLEDCISGGYPVVFLNTIDSTGIDSAAIKAKDAGMILIAIDTPQDNPEPLVSTVASDNYQAGVLCAQKLAEALDEKGELGAYLRSTSKVAALRGSGFMDTIEADYPNMEIVNKQEGTAGSADAALPCMENILQGTPNITGQFALNDPSAQGCISAIKAAGKIDQIKVVGVDGSKEAKQFVHDGEMLGSSAQFPGEMGRQAVDIAIAAMKGETVEPEVLIPTQWMDITNCDTMQNYDYDN